ncbi:MAG: tRNA (adenosine(37)-N6)-threonylcarbamoyltransferase complex dimerization subunit type 1 TsaB [Anaerolineaceae bacterium]
MLLAIDTSTKWVGLALYDGIMVGSEQIWQTRDHHTIELAKSVNHLLEQTGVQPTEINVLAVATGPGSFTSLRIGLALAKGMALALNVPLIGIPSLDILVAALPPGDYPLIAVLQAGRGRLAAIRYESGSNGWQPINQPVICDMQGLFTMMDGLTMVAGELNVEQRHLLSDRRKHILLASPAACLRRPSYLAELAWKRFTNGEYDDSISLAPIYIHMAEVLPD